MRICFVAFLLLSVTFSSSAGIINAKSGTRDDIQASINSARVGDTVKIPAGNFIMNGGVTVQGGITIMGAGRDRTTLRRTASSSAWMFTVNCSNGGRLVLTGFTIQGLAPTMSRGIKLTNHCKEFRIYDNTFRKLNDRAIEIHGHTRGVVDRNSFYDNEPTAVVMFGDGDAAWKRPLSLGTAEAVFVENNYFEQRNVANPDKVHHIASNNGSRYVFRNNTIVDGNINGNAVDAHGNKFYWPRGSRSYEVYDNTYQIGHRWAGMNLRGGDGVVFNNHFTGSLVSPIHLIHEGREGDGNCKYPCVDQIRQLHLWNNTYNAKVVGVYNRHPAIVGLNRDYFLSENKNYKPYTYPHPLTLGSSAPSTNVIQHREQAAGDQGISLQSVMDKSGYGARISYTLPPGSLGKDPLVRINIFDIRGRLVRSLFREHRSGGSFHLVWDGAGADSRPVATGLYRVVMINGDRKISNTLMIMR